eukprot:1987480-Pleurochrysis_carterae.AAC.2
MDSSREASTVRRQPAGRWQRRLEGEQKRSERREVGDVAGRGCTLRSFDASRTSNAPDGLLGT